MCVDQLNKQGEIGKLRRLRSKRSRPCLRKPVRKCLSCCCAVCDHAHAVLMTGEFPALGNFRQLRIFSILVS